MRDHLLVAAVGAAGQQHDIGPDLLDLPQLRLRQLERIRADDLGPGSQRRPATGLGGVLGHETHADDSQPAGGAAAGHGLPPLFLAEADGVGQQRERLLKTDRDVGVDRGRDLHPSEELFALHVEGHQLGEGAAEVDEEPRACHYRRLLPRPPEPRRPTGRSARTRSRSPLRSSIAPLTSASGGYTRSKPLALNLASSTAKS